MEAISALWGQWPKKLITLCICKKSACFAAKACRQQRVLSDSHAAMFRPALTAAPRAPYAFGCVSNALLHNQFRVTAFIPPHMLPTTCRIRRCRPSGLLLRSQPRPSHSVISARTLVIRQASQDRSSVESDDVVIDAGRDSRRTPVLTVVVTAASLLGALLGPSSALALVSMADYASDALLDPATTAAATDGDAGVLGTLAVVALAYVTVLVLYIWLSSFLDGDANSNPPPDADLGELPPGYNPMLGARVRRCVAAKQLDATLQATLVCMPNTPATAPPLCECAAPKPAYHSIRLPACHPDASCRRRRRLVHMCSYVDPRRRGQVSALRDLSQAHPLEGETLHQLKARLAAGAAEALSEQLREVERLARAKLLQYKLGLYRTATTTATVQLAGAHAQQPHQPHSGSNGSTDVGSRSDIAALLRAAALSSPGGLASAQHRAAVEAMVTQTLEQLVRVLLLCDVV